MTRKQIIKKIGSPHLSLYSGEGYFYFVYDNGNPHAWGDHSVYVYRLHDMSLEQWIEEGKNFLQEVTND